MSVLCQLKIHVGLSVVVDHPHYQMGWIEVDMHDMCEWWIVVCV